MDRVEYMYTPSLVDTWDTLLSLEKGAEMISADTIGLRAETPDVIAICRRDCPDNPVSFAGLKQEACMDEGFIDG